MNLIKYKVQLHHQRNDTNYQLFILVEKQKALVLQLLIFCFRIYVNMQYPRLTMYCVYSTLLLVCTMYRVHTILLQQSVVLGDVGEEFWRHKVINKTTSALGETTM